GEASPGTHHEHVVDRDHSDRVDALGQDGIVVFEIAWQVVVVAGGGECARNAEQDDFLAAEDFSSAEALRPVFSHGGKRQVRQLLANSNCHDFLVIYRGRVGPALPGQATLGNVTNAAKAGRYRHHHWSEAYRPDPRLVRWAR